MSSEGACRQCGSPLGISGHCDACAVADNLEQLFKQAPTCKQCGGPMLHSRLNGYRCALSWEHKGIVWPQQEEQARV
jgi:predicted amidophosphoribosyltransferase